MSTDRRAVNRLVLCPVADNTDVFDPHAGISLGNLYLTFISGQCELKLISTLLSLILRLLDSASNLQHSET